MRPTMEKHDRVFMSPDWEDLFPPVTVKKIVREISDHKPLILDSGEDVINLNKARGFKFDISWITHDDCLPLVKEIREKPIKSQESIDIFNNKFKKFKKKFKGWGSNLFGNNRKKRNELNEELSVLELLEEGGSLLPERCIRKNIIQNELHQLYVEKELQWF